MKDFYTLIRFVATGGVAALLFVALSSLFRLWLDAPAYIASGAGFVISFAFAFPVQLKWTFNSHHSIHETLPRYLVTQIICLFMSTVLSETMISFWGRHDIAVFSITAIFVSFISYSLSRFWVFRGFRNVNFS